MKEIIKESRIRDIAQAIDKSIRHTQLVRVRVGNEAEALEIVKTLCLDIQLVQHLEECIDVCGTKGGEEFRLVIRTA